MEAPAKSRPIADLTSQLRGAGALGALGGSGGSSAQPPTATTPTPGGAVPEQEGGGVESFQEYSKCLDDARPDDTAALSRCAELLR